MPATRKRAGPYTNAFWLQRISPLSLVQPRDSFMTFLCVPLSITAPSFGTNSPDLVQGWFLVNESHLRAVVGGVHPGLRQKDPQRVHLPQQTTGKASGGIGAVMILLNEPAQPGIPRLPLPACRWGRGHMTQPLQLCQRPRATRRQFGVLALCQAPRRPDEVRQARLPCLSPVAVHSITVTDQDPYPVVDEGREGCFGAVWVDHVERHRVTGHDPQPL